MAAIDALNTDIRPGEGVATLDAEGRILDADPVFARSLGHDSVGLIGRRLADIAGVRALPPVEGAANDDGPRRFRYQPPGGGGDAGGERLLLQFANPGGERDQGPPHWVLVRPLNHEHGQEHASVESLMAVHHRGLLAMLVVDRGGIVIDANRALCRMLDYPPEELIGSPVERLLPSAMREHHVGLRERFWQTPSARSMTTSQRLAIVPRSGLALPVQIGLTPFSTPVGKFVCCFVFDISQRLRAEQQFVAQQVNIKRLQILNEELSSFSRSASHDLKSPIRTAAGLLSMARTALASGDRAELDQLLDMLCLLNRRQYRVVDSLLKYSSADGEAAKPSTVDVKQTLQAIWLSLSWDDRAMPRLQLDIELDAPVSVDATALDSIVQNLLDNAIKYADHDKPDCFVKVSAGRVGNRLQIIVQDNGIGIDEQRVDEAFKPFKRLSRQSDGHGLGLSLVSKAATRAGGEVRLHSQPGLGTTVEVSLPCSNAAATAA